ncbi:MAG: ABC transporter permease [Lachnospiraceae bacterium]|nr:ABC transporter permease [Lachnospiraceae bacterium]
MIIFSFIRRAVMQGVPLLYGSTGEIITEKSGHLNLGIPGIMYMGAIGGVIGGFFFEQTKPDFNHWYVRILAVLVALFCSLLFSCLMGLLYCFLTVSMRANQNVTGLALTTFGVGMGNFFGGSLIKISHADVPNITLTDTSGCFAKHLPFVDTVNNLAESGKCPKVLAEICSTIFSYSALAYLAIVVALVASHVLMKTRVGLTLRSVGEDPATADAAGINVNRYKYVATCLGSMIAGLGGLYYIMDYACGVWSSDGFGDRGWLSVALVIFSLWRPGLAIIGSFIFGGMYIIHNYIGGQTIPLINYTIPKLSMQAMELFKMSPYVMTLLVLIFVSIKEKREALPPAHLGLNYFREER